jgi:hypothetical protein
MDAARGRDDGEHRITGVGIDIEEPAALDRFDEAAVRRAAERLLSPREWAWCRRQPSLRRAFTIVISCREAVFKACRDAPAVAAVQLRMAGGPLAGHAAWNGPESIGARVAWRLRRGVVVALAVAGGERCPSSS